MVKALGKFLRWLLFLLFLGYEVLFWGYSLLKLMLGGSAGAVGWWWHLQVEGCLECARNPFNWTEFLFGQFVILSIFGTLWFFERRPLKVSRELRS